MAKTKKTKDSVPVETKQNTETQVPTKEQSTASETQPQNLLTTTPASLQTKTQSFAAELIPDEQIRTLVDLNYNESVINLLILKLEQIKEKYNLQRLAWVRDNIIKSGANKLPAAVAQSAPVDQDIL